jgi:hypothetical protein
VPGGTEIALKVAPSVAIIACLEYAALMSAKNGYFKWHYFMNNNRVWVHPLFRKGVSLEGTTTCLMH